MKLNEEFYAFRQESGVWARPDYAGISYSDGEEQENGLLEIVKKTTDLSVFSAELRNQCTDWVSTYHLSSLRANLLQPLNFLFQPNTKVLEIGAGCGAITRFLGETRAEVLALEGSLRRATIARIRTEELKNVTVLSERFDDLETDEKFDVITLIGVLEYSNLFSQGVNSAINMLDRIKAKLKPAGKVIIAIENQLGLKYFAGAREDHVGQVMYGIEGRYTNKQAETYGYHTLIEMLASVGLSKIETLLPFPDYKLPLSLVTERGALDKNFDASIFASQSVCADMQLPEKLNIIPELAWPVVFKNNLAIELSNSFLLVASAVATDSYDKNLLAIHYGSERDASFRKRTIFCYNIENEIEVIRELANNTESINNSHIGFKLEGNKNYIRGITLSLEFIKIVTSPDWSIDLVAHFFLYYIKCLEVILRKEGVFFGEFSQFTKLPPAYLDAIPSNIIIDDKEKKPHYFEREWLAKDDLTLGHLVFRSILSLMGKVSSFAIPQSRSPLTREEFVYQLFDRLSFSAEETLLNQYMELESKLHDFSLGIIGVKNGTWFPKHILPGLQQVYEMKIREENIQNVINSLTTAKEKAEEYAFERLDKVNSLTQELQSLQSLWVIRLLKKFGIYSV